MITSKLKENNIEMLLSDVSDTILNNFTQADFSTFWTQLVPSSILGFTLLISSE